MPGQDHDSEKSWYEGPPLGTTFTTRAARPPVQVEPSRKFPGRELGARAGRCSSPGSGTCAGRDVRDNSSNRCSSRVHIKSFSRPHTVSGSSSSSLKSKFRNYRLGGLHDGSLERAVAKAEVLKENDHACSCDSQMPRVPGADEHDQLVDKVVDVIVSMQQQVSAVQVVQETVPFINRSSRTENSEDASDPELRWSDRHFRCVTGTGTHGVQFVEQVVVMPVVVLLTTPKIHS